MSMFGQRKHKENKEFTMTKLEKYLKSRGISQRFFAKKIGTTPTNLSSLINGKSTPSLGLAYEIEKHTDGHVTVYDWIPNASNETDTDSRDNALNFEKRDDE